MGDAKRREQAGQMPWQRPQEGPRHLPPNITPGQIVPSGHKVIAFLAPALDCCTEKIIGEMAPYWQKDKYFTVVVNEKKCKEVLKFMPHIVVLFRVATKQIQIPEVQEIGGFVKHMQGLGVKVFYYIDDLLINANKGAPMFLASLCDEIIVATDRLKQIFRTNIGLKPINIIKTHIDLPAIDSFPRSPLVPFSGYNILMSSSGRIGTLMMMRIMDYMNQHPEKYKDVNMLFIAGGVSQIRSVVNKFRNIKKHYFEFMPSRDFYSVCKSVDLILSPGEIGDLDYMIPREQQQAWLDSKSCLKYTLAGAAGIPCIASRKQAEYASAIKHGETGFLADSLEEWMRYIDLCHEDKEAATKIGEAARKDMEDNWNITKRANDFLDVLTGRQRPGINTNKIWLPLYGGGGPGTFSSVMHKYVPQIDSKWETVEFLSDPVQAAIVVAYIGAPAAIKKKEENSSIKLISRVDGLPYNLDTGELQMEHLNIMQEVMHKADIIVYQSEFCKRAWAPYTKGIATPSTIIPNGVDREIFSPEGEKFPMDKTKFNILHVNYSTFQHKRKDLLEDIIKYAGENLPNVHFTLVGQYIDTTIIKDMQKWAAYDNVTYIGTITGQYEAARRKLASLYRAADALLFTSKMEGSPNTALEAFGCGLPIIYNTEADIIPELQGETGFGFHDAESFEQIVRNWDTKLIEFIKKEKLPKLAVKYSAENMVKAYLEILK